MEVIIKEIAIIFMIILFCIIGHYFGYESVIIALLVRIWVYRDNEQRKFRKSKRIDIRSIRERKEHGRSR